MRLLSLLLITLLAGILQAQNVEVVASGFAGINGLTYDSDGNVWVTEAGTGSNDGKVSVITPDKVVHPVVTGLPSFLDTLEGDAPGAWQAYHNDDLLQVVVGGGIDPNAASLMTFDLSNWSPGDAPFTVANATSILDIDSYLFANGYTDSDPYRASWDNSGNIYIVDAGANVVLKKEPGNNLSIIHTFAPFQNIWSPFPPVIDYVPTSIIRNPAGGFFVCNLTGFPFIPGLSSVVKMDDSGNVTPFADSLSLSVDMELDNSGNLYVLQFGEFDTLFNPIFNSSRITKITPSGNKSVFAAGFGPSAGMALDGNGGVYVTNLFLGQVLHITDLTGTETPVDKASLSLNATPNPAESFTAIDFNLPESAVAAYRLYGMQGELLQDHSLGFLASGPHHFQADLRNLSSGCYFLQLNTGQGNRTIKIMVK